MDLSLNFTIFSARAVCVMSEVAAIVRVLIYAFKARLITSTYTETSTQTQTHAHKRSHLMQWAAKLCPPNCILIAH